MKTSWVSQTFGNTVWLLFAFIFTEFLQEFFSTSIPTLSTKDSATLAVSILGCSILCDLLLAKEKKYSFLNFILFFVMAVSIVLVLMSQAQQVATLSPSPVILTLAGFIFCKSLHRFFTSDWRYPKFLCTKVMILGDRDRSEVIYTQIDNSRGRFSLEGIIAAKPDTSTNVTPENTPDSDNDRLYLEARKAGVQTIIVSFPERRGVMPVQQMLKCRMLGMNIVEAQTFYEFISRKLYIENLKPSDIIFSSGFTLSLTRRFFKRTCDIASSILGLLIFAPFFPFIALAIRLDSPGPIFFRQVRVGRGDRLFHIIKFRSMCNNAEKGTGAVWAAESDPRVTRVGAFLRKTRIDEIPQLINVLQGSMSLVGPRPERPEFIGELKKSIPFYGERHSVKPGMTGWAQVCYPYGASVEDALEKLRYDLYYIKRQSIWIEIEILLRTILIIFTGHGAR